MIPKRQEQIITSVAVSTVGFILLYIAVIIFINLSSSLRRRKRSQAERAYTPARQLEVPAAGATPAQLEVPAAAEQESIWQHYSQQSDIGKESASRHTGCLQDEVPTLRELYHYVVLRVSYKWEELGVYLELDRDGARLAAIKRSYVQLGVETCCMQMFMVWLREGKRELVNWGTIFSCLENIGSRAIIQEIINNLTDDAASERVTDAPPDLLTTLEVEL